jgi:hypothetical protein
MLTEAMRSFLTRSGWQERATAPAMGLLSFFVRTGEIVTDVRLWPDLLTDPAARRFLELNEFQGVTWFSKESIELLATCLAEIALAERWESPQGRIALAAAEASGYRWNDFCELLRPKNIDPRPKNLE